jgi:hypothetical protein
MEAYCEEVWRLEDKFHGLELNHITCRYNEATDELMKIASSRATVPPDVFARDLHQPSNDLGPDGGVDGPSLGPPPKAEAPSTRAEAMQVEGSTPPSDPEPDWRIPYLDHLIRGDLPSNKIEDRRITRRAKTFVIFGDNRELYRLSPIGVLQCCITNEEGRSLLNDLLSGGLWSPCSTSHSCRKCFSTGFLLANRSLRHHQASTLLQRLPVLCSSNSSLSSCPANHPHHMVICCLGARPCRTLEKDNWRLHPLARCH